MKPDDNRVNRPGRRIIRHHHRNGAVGEGIVRRAARQRPVNG